MASIDIIQNVGLAYQRTWAERRYLLPMIIVPFLIKYFCFTLGDIFAERDNILRLSLIMLPAYFAEGWLLAHWVRTLVVGHRWPYKLTGDDQADMKALKLRGRGVLSGAVCFTLINFLMAGYFSFFMSYMPADMNPEQADPTVALVGIIMMVSTILLFRYIWFYIPLSVNTPPQLFLRSVNSFKTTFPLLGVWLVCVVPSVAALQLIGGVLTGMVPEGQENVVISNALTVATIMADMVKNLLCTAGLSFAIMELVGLKKK